MFFLGLLIVVFMRVLWAIKVDFFIDEGFSSVVVRQPISDVVQTVAADYNTFLHYTYIRVWGLLFGDSHLSLRLSSIVVSVLLIFVFYRLTLFFFKQKHIRQMLTLLYAAIPSILYYSFDVRMYGFMQLWVLISIFYVCKSIAEKPTWRDVVFFAGSMIAGFYSHMLFGLHICILGIYAIIYLRKTHVNRFLVSFAMAALSFLLYLSPLLSQIKDKASEGWLIFRYWTSVIQTQFSLFLFPDPYRSAPLWQIILVVVFSIAAIVGLYKTKTNQSRFLLFVLLVTHIIFFFVSFKLPVYYYRYMVHIVPFYIIGFGLFLQQIHVFSDRERIGLLGILALACVIWSIPPKNVNLPIRDVLPYLEHYHEQGYELVSESPFTYFPLEQYFASKGIRVLIYTDWENTKKYLGRSGINMDRYLPVLDPKKQYILIRDPNKDTQRYQIQKNDWTHKVGKLTLIRISQ